MTTAVDRLGSSRRRRVIGATTPTIVSTADEAEAIYSVADSTRTNVPQVVLNGQGGTWKKVSSCWKEGKWSSRIEKACSEGHRCMQLLYLFTFCAGWAYVFHSVYPMADDVGSHHRIIGVVVFLSCALSWVLASTVSPGNITAESMAKYDNYHYDNLLYANRVCPTLQIRKLARSKFDRYSQTHVPKYDHFCPVLMQSVGEENYRLFLAFLILHTGMCFYGCDILCRILWGIVARDPETSKLLVESKLSVMTALRRLVVMFLLNHPLGYLIAFLFVCSLAMTKFLGFHLYLITRGMTTNEYYKWQDVYDLYEYERLRWNDKNIRRAEAGARAGVAAVDDVESPSAGDANRHLQQQQQQQQLNYRDKYNNALKNTYNLGIVNNMHEVLFPRCLRAQNKKKSKHRDKRK